MKKALLAILPLLLITSYFLYNKNTEVKSTDEEYFYQKLKEFQESGKSSIALKELTNFEWDEVCDIQPYSGNPDFENRNLKLDKDLPSADDDSKFAFIFIHQNHGKVFILNRGNNHPQIMKGNCPLRDEALIQLIN